MVLNDKGGCKGKKVARKHLTKGKNELRLSHSVNEKYAIVKRLLGNTCDVICDDGKERRCMIRGKFTGRNKRDNMLDSGAYILVGLREWVNEDMSGGGGGGSGNKNIKFCDLLEVYNSSERDILRRTHGIFDNLKDESIIGKYDDHNSLSVTFVDHNTLKYQEMVKNMEGKNKNKNKEHDGSRESRESGGSGSEDDDETCNEQNIIITTNVKHIGKGVISQSYDISESDSEGDSEGDEDEDEDEEHKPVEKGEKEYKYKQPSKKFEYTQENIVNIDDI